MADGVDDNRVVDDFDLAGVDRKRLRRRPARRNQGCCFRVSVTSCARRQIVVDGDGELDAVVLRQRDRQVDVREEVLEDLDRAGRAAELPGQRRWPAC